ncbi:hypothetical protein C9994_10390 [Marivirga lumbricoides]|uniref:Uncharacterized protein n=1 Tax=Marivirga lumbricoides TaxID=1046115 RepID=A0A2T4DPL0_9BACT|nr:hypothetical protein C9994_10390 [Marivirga lumbricoides]
MKTESKNNMNWKVYSIFSSLLLFTILATAFTTSQLHQKMDELTVKRINIIEDDGTIRMVLSNKARQHSGTMDGEDSPHRVRHSGMIFFNDEGDECGGLIFGATDKDGKVSSGMSITFDQYKNDQVIQILNQELVDGDKINSSRGFMINDYPGGSNLMKTMKDLEYAKAIEDNEERKARMVQIQKESGVRSLMFLGKTRGNSNGLFLNDLDGNPKLMIYVDQNGDPKIQTFDENQEIKDFL